MKNIQVLDFIDQNSGRYPKRLLSTTQNVSGKSTKLLEKFYMKLTLIITRLKPYSSDFAPKVVKILNSIVYKYGHAYKHHMFLRRARHSYSIAKKLSTDRIFLLIKQIASALSDSQYEHSLTNDAIDHLNAVILHRIMMLDKLRIVCAKNIDFSIGYVERKHNINLNLLFIALAAELGQLALTQIRVLAKTYNELASFFQSLPQSCIPRLNELPLKSCSVDDRNELLERKIDIKQCGLSTFVSFLNETEESEDLPDKYELAKIEELKRILRDRPANTFEVRSKKKKSSSEQEHTPNFYREISNNRSKKRKRRR